MYALWLETGAVGQLAQDEECAGSRERAAARVQEELRPVAPVEVRPPQREVAPHRLRSRPPERHEPLLAALAEHPHDALLDGDAALLEPDGLRDTQPGAVEELDERAVAKSTRRGSRCSVDQPFRLRGRQCAR